MHEQTRNQKAFTNPTESGFKRGWLETMGHAHCVDVLLLGALELGFRVCGVGYPTRFLLKRFEPPGATFVQNNQFGWRFFGAQMARIPAPISLPITRAHGTIRVLVFGESAAFGDPQPRYGLPRMLEALLELRCPGVSFEVVNAGMTGINSHVVPQSHPVPSVLQRK